MLHAINRRICLTSVSINFIYELTYRPPTEWRQETRRRCRSSRVRWRQTRAAAIEQEAKFWRRQVRGIHAGKCGGRDRRRRFSREPQRRPEHCVQPGHRGWSADWTSSPFRMLSARSEAAYPTLAVSAACHTHPPLIHVFCIHGETRVIAAMLLAYYLQQCNVCKLFKHATALIIFMWTNNLYTLV